LHPVPMPLPSKLGKKENRKYYNQVFSRQLAEQTA